MKVIVAIGVAVGMLWLVDVFLNDGRYEQVIERGILNLVGKQGGGGSPGREGLFVSN